MKIFTSKEAKKIMFPRGIYNVNFTLGNFEKELEDLAAGFTLNLNPIYQRGSVWSLEQKQKYIEFLLKKPKDGITLYFNCSNFTNLKNCDFNCLDGQQRIKAILDFLHGKIKPYGFIVNQFEEKVLKAILLEIVVFEFKTIQEEALWYLNFNSAGVNHSEDDIKKALNVINS